MSRLDDLIAELCPDGVEYKPVGYVCDIQTGSQLNKDTLKDKGAYPVYNGGIYPSGYHDDYNTEANTIAISQGGASAGFVNWVGVPFYAGAHCYTVKNNSQKALSRYMYFFLKNKQNHIQDAKHGAGIPGLNSKVIKNLQFPLPPLPIQQEIVRILDKFTALEAELEAELEARNKQYEYYRDSLLDFDGQLDIPFKWATVAQVCNKVSSGGTPSTSIKDYYEGNIPWLRTQEVDFSDIYDTEVKITKEGIENSSATWIPANCVIVAMYGATAAKIAINKIPLTTNQACCNLQINKEKALFKYVFHWLASQYHELRAMGQGSQSNINAKTVKNFPIPLPPLPIQQEIVSILDRFDSLTDDITQGLSAEIAARRKQYEYYRNELLTFKEKIS